MTSTTTTTVTMTVPAPQPLIYKSDYQVYVPTTDLLSWTFGNPKHDHPTKPLLIDAHNTDRSLTFSQCRTTVKKIIAGLRARGVQKGTCVCLHAFNDIYYVLLYLAIIGAGGVLVGSNPGYKELELTSLVKGSKSHIIISAPDLLPVVRNVTQTLGMPESSILVFAEPKNTPEGYTSWEDLLNHGEEDWVRFDDEKLSRETPASLCTTSGTTGLPKMALLSHYSWVAFNACVEDPLRKPYDVKRLVSLPMFHTYTTPLSHFAPFRSGHQAYIMPRFSKSKVPALVEQLGINEIVMVPPMIFDFTANAGPATEFLRNVKFVFCGGAPLDGATIKQFYGMLAPEACIAQVYGMTEAGWIASSKYPDRDDSGAVGKILPNVEAKLVDHNGNVVREPGLKGEIRIKGSRLMNEYLNNPEATADAYEDGWLKTGDIGVIDENGRLFIVDREKDLIKVRGWQVSPAEIEGVLRTHPQILDAAVTSVPLKGAEAPKALVVRSDETLTEEAVKAFIANLLVGYKHLDGGATFVDAIPKSNSGKILRKELRTM